MSLTLRDIAVRVRVLGGVCASCGRTLFINSIHSYDHDGGLPVQGFAEKQWVYFHCKRCGYDSALWKVLNRLVREWSKKPFESTRGREIEAFMQLWKDAGGR